MSKILEEYFADKTAISNSQLRNFVKYDKWGNRLITPDIYNAYDKDLVEFEVTDPIIVWKMVDAFYDKTHEYYLNSKKLLEKYIPVSKRNGKAIQKIVEIQIAEKSVELIKEKDWYIGDRDMLEQEVKDMNMEENPLIDDIVKREDEINEINIEIDILNDKLNDIRIEVENFVDKNYTEITNTMLSDFNNMIKWWEAFVSFKELLADEDTVCQNILHQTIAIVDSEGEITEVNIKWLPDMVNVKRGLIVDLKTTGSMDMIIDGLQFRGKPNVTAPYIRQLTIYREMLWQEYTGALALLTNKWCIWIDVPSIILDRAWDIIQKDILELVKYKANPKTFTTSIFDLSKLDKEEDEFRL